MPLIFILLAIKGAVFVFLIPLWQGPDEPTHIEYIMRLSQESHFDPHLKSDDRIQKRIRNSMQANNFDFIGAQMTDGNISPLANKKYPPFFYFINSYLVKLFKIEKFESQIYFMRFLSMIFGLGSVFFIYMIAKEIFGIDEMLYSLAAVSFAGFLPQFSYMTATVNPHNLANLIITAIVLICILGINYGPRWHYCFLVMALMVAGWFTKETILIALPFIFIIFGLPFLKRLMGSKYQKIVKILSFFLLASFICLSFFNLFSNDILNKIYGQILNYLEMILGFMMIGLQNPFLYFKETAILFVSFWLTYGFMVYKMSIGWYFFLFGISVLSIIGLFYILKEKIKDKNSVKKNEVKVVLFLIVLLLFNFGVIFYDEASKNFYLNSESITTLFYAQGRYLFPSISAISCLFVLGIKGFSARFTNNKDFPIKLIIVFMIFLNGVSVFNYLIPLYYL